MTEAAVVALKLNGFSFLVVPNVYVGAVQVTHSSNITIIASTNVRGSVK